MSSQLESRLRRFSRKLQKGMVIYMKKEHNISAVVMLIAGAVSVLCCLIRGTEIRKTLEYLLIVLVIFLIVGRIAEKIISQISEAAEEAARQAEEEAKKTAREQAEQEAEAAIAAATEAQERK